MNAMFPTRAGDEPQGASQNIPSPSTGFRDLVALAAAVTQTPTAIIAIVSGDRPEWRAQVGAEGLDPALIQSFLERTLRQRGCLVVPDFAEDASRGVVSQGAGDSRVRFLAGTPLLGAGGSALGAICVLDAQPRVLTENQGLALEALARQAVALLQLDQLGDGEVEELRASELRYRRLFEAAQDGILILDAETGRITDVNSYLLELLDFTRSEVLGRTVGELSPFKDIESNQAMLEKLQANGYVRYDDLPLETKDGSSRAVEFISNVYRAGSQNVIQCNIREITVRKALNERVNLLETCIANFEDIILITEAEPIDEPGPRILFVNDAFEKLTGYTSAETVGRSPRFLQGPETDPAVRKELREALEGQCAIHRQIVNYKKSGKPYWMDVNIVPIRDASGKCTHYAAIERDVTAAKQKDESLQLFRTLIDRSSDAIEVIDAETGRLLDVNQTACDRLGYTQEEMLKLTLVDIVASDPHVPFSIEKTLERVKNSGSLVVETRHRRKDGSTFPIEVNTQYLELDRPYLVSVVRDITERKRTASLLQERGELLSLYTENSPAATAMFDPEMRYLIASRGWREAYRLGDQPLIGRSHYDVFPEITRLWREVHQRCLQGAVEKCEEEPFQRADGKIDWIRWEVRPWRRADNSIGGIVMFSENITDRKIAEAARQVIEARYRLLVDSNVQSVFFWHRDGAVTGANDAFLKLVNRSRADLEAGLLDWVALTPAEYAARDQEALQEIDLRGVCDPYEKEFVLQDGTRVSILIGAARFKDSPARGVCFVVDLTERKKLRKQVQQSQRLESIGTLAGGIAHDLNNVLAPIMMGASLLRLHGPSEKSAAVIEIIESSAQRGAELVKQVLSFARGVEGANVAVHVGDVVNEIRSIVRSTFPKNIQFEVRVSPDLWLISSDPTQIHQVLMNLCVNARDAMPSGGRLNVEVDNAVIDPQFAAQQPGLAAGNYVRVRVGDTGSGISRENLEKIFLPFFTTKELGHGTGLGLATTMGIVRGHGGTLTVESEVGKGTVFTILFPVPADKNAAPSFPHAAHDFPVGKGEWVLLVDDESAILDITRRTLESFGYRVLTAQNGALAVGLFAERRRDIAVVVIDLMMPVMDGAASIPALRKIDPLVKIIAVSGLKGRVGGDGGAQGSVKYFLAKPYSTEELLVMLGQCLAEPAE